MLAYQVPGIIMKLSNIVVSCILLTRNEVEIAIPVLQIRKQRLKKCINMSK